MIPKNGKPRIAFFDFTSCEGCQLTVIDALQTHPELLDAVEIVEFREAMSERSDDYQIAFIEGSCTRSSDEARLQRIRANAGIVVALGACAHLGGVNAIRNRQPLEDVRQYVYGDKAHWYDTYEPRAIDKVIGVDVVIPGCPIDRVEFVSTVKALLQGRMPEPPDYPLCIECRALENVCVYDRAQVCLGPVVRAGCGAICPAYGVGCDGCRGLIGDARMAVLQAVLQEHGLSQEAIDARLTIFLTNQVKALVEKEEEAAYV